MKTKVLWAATSSKLIACRQKEWLLKRVRPPHCLTTNSESLEMVSRVRSFENAKESEGCLQSVERNHHFDRSMSSMMHNTFYYPQFPSSPIFHRCSEALIPLTFTSFFQIYTYCTSAIYSICPLLVVWPDDWLRLLVPGQKSESFRQAFYAFEGPI